MQSRILWKSKLTGNPILENLWFQKIQGPSEQEGEKTESWFYKTETLEDWDHLELISRIQVQELKYSWKASWTSPPRINPILLSYTSKKLVVSPPISDTLKNEFWILKLGNLGILDFSIQVGSRFPKSRGYKKWLPKKLEIDNL